MTDAHDLVQTDAHDIMKTTIVFIRPEPVATGHAQEGLHATEVVMERADRIEKRLRAELDRFLAQEGRDIDPDSISVRWRCEVEVMGYQMPEGWLDESLPEEDQQRLREEWLEVVKIAESRRQRGLSTFIDCPRPPASIEEK